MSTVSAHRRVAETITSGSFVVPPANRLVHDADPAALSGGNQRTLTAARLRFAIGAVIGK